MRYSSIKNSQF
uniref:Uncharacterized protein n=1 Tax=Anguilla anguilla TaxID=7936 RepID=A0A0E9T704_ANGAN